MAEPTTSFVMAARDAEATVAGTIESVLAQTDSDFELIVVNDGSRDSTPDILTRYAARDPRIRVMANPQSVGLTRSLIVGCEAARGDFIARQDAGDLSHPRRLERQRARLEEDASVSFVSCWTQFAGPELEPLYISRGSGAAEVPTSIIDISRPNGLVDGPTCHPSVLFRRDVYQRAGGYRAEFYFGQDWDLWYRIAALGKLQIVPEALYTARVSPQSISGVWRSAQESLGRLSREALLARSHGESEAAILARAAEIRPEKTPRAHQGPSKGLYFIGEALRHNGDRRARGYFRAAIKAHPLYPQAWLRWLQTLL